MAPDLFQAPRSLGPATIRTLLAALAAGALAACPQEIISIGPDGGGEQQPDAGHETPSCAKPGPELECWTDGNRATYRVGELIQIRCEARNTLGREVTFDGPRSTLASASLDKSWGPVSGTAYIQLLHSMVRVDFADTAVQVDIGAHWQDDPTACTWTTVELKYVGNLWVADPDRGGVWVLASDGQLVSPPGGGDALVLPGMARPQLLARAPDGVVVAGLGGGASPEVAIYSRTGERQAGPFDLQGNLIGKTLQGLARAGDGSIYVSTSGGSVFRRDVEGLVETLTVPAYPAAPGAVLGVSAWGSSVLFGLADRGGAIARLSGGSSSAANEIRPTYTDTANGPCGLESVFGVAALDSGNIWLSARDAFGTTGYGANVLLSPRFLVLARTKHTHGSSQGDLAIAGPLHWMAEAAPGVLVGTRPGSTAVECFDDALAPCTPRTWGNLPAAARPKGLVRLR